MSTARAVGVFALGVLLWLGIAFPAQAAVSVSVSDAIAVEPAPQAIEGAGVKPAVASSGAGWLTVWGNGLGGISGRLVDHDGTPTGMPFDVAPGLLDVLYTDVSLWSLDVAFDGTDFVVVWLDTWSSYSSWGTTLKAQRVSVDGDLIGDQQVLTSGNPMLLAVASGGGAVLAAVCANGVYYDVECSLYQAAGGTFELTDTGEFDGIALGQLSLGFSQASWLMMLDGAYLRVAADGVFVDAVPTKLHWNNYTSIPSLRQIAPTSTGFAVVWDASGSIELADVPFDGAAVLRAAPLRSATADNTYQLPTLRQVSGGYLIAYRKQCDRSCGEPSSLSFLELDQNLDPVGSEVPTRFDPGHPFDPPPNFAFDASAGLVVYVSEQGVVLGQRLALNPVATDGSSISLPLAAAGQTDIHGAPLGDGWLVVWDEGDPITSSLKAAVLDARGEAQQKPFWVRKSIQRFLDVSGGPSGGLIAFLAGYTTNLAHVALDGTIDNTAELERASLLQLASSSSGWLALYDSYEWSQNTLKAQRIALDGTPLEATVMTAPTDDMHGAAVVTTADGYKVFWSAQGSIWSRRLLFDGTWLCDRPTLVASPEGGVALFSGTAAGGSSWFTWSYGPNLSAYKLLTLPSGAITYPRDEARFFSPVNSLAVGLTVRSNYPSLLTYRIATAEPSQPLVESLQVRARQASLSTPAGNHLLLASTNFERIYGATADRVRTSIVTVSGGLADVVPTDTQADECPPPPQGEGGAGGSETTPGTGGSSDEGGAPSGGAPTQPIGGAPSVGGVAGDQGGDSNLAAGRDSVGGTPPTMDGGAPSDGTGGNGTNEPQVPAQPSGGDSQASPVPGDAGAGEPTAPSHTSRGCGCTIPGDTSSPLPLLVTVLALCAARRRRSIRAGSRGGDQGRLTVRRAPQAGTPSQASSESC